MPFELDTATTSAPVSAGLRRIDLTADWNTPAGTANGGYLLAILLSAVLSEAAQTGAGKPDPLSAAVTYLKPTTTGPAEISIAPVREGRRVATYTAVLSQGGTPVTHAVISLHDADLAGDARFEDEAAPEIASPSDCIDPTTDWPSGLVPIAERYTTLHPESPGWMSGAPSGSPAANFWIRPVDSRPIDAFAAGAIVDAYPPVTAELDHLASSTVQLTVHFWRRFTSDWVQMEVVTRRIVDGFHDEDVRLWDADGRLVATSRQIALLA